MKKTTVFLLTATILLAAITAGCSAGGGAPDVAAVPPPATQVALQPATSTPVPPAPTFVPKCTEDPACAPPDVNNTEPGDTYCVKKVPYQNFTLVAGAEMVVGPTSDLKCADSGTLVETKGKHKGDHIWTCTGKQLWTYPVTITNPACKPRLLVIDASKCQAGLKFDAAQNCCTVSDQNSGVATVEINMGACP